MIKNFILDPNTSTHKINLVGNPNNITNNIDKGNNKILEDYQKMVYPQNSGMVVDYTVAENNRIKSLVKSKKEG